MNQLKSGVVLNYILILINTLVGLVYTPYMLRMMGQSEYGLYALVASVISYLTILDLGLGNAIIRYTAKFRAENKMQEQYEMFGMFFILYLAIGIIALFAGCALCFNVDSIFGSTMTIAELEKARIMLIMLVFNLAFTFPMSIFGSIITAYERFIFPRIVTIIRIILNTIVMVVLLKMGYRAIAMVIVQTVFNILTLCLNYIYCKKKLHIKICFGKFNWSLLKEIAIYSFWIFLNVIMDKVYWSTGQFVLGALVGTIAVSVYAVAIQLQHLYMQFSSAISSIFLPKVTALVASASSDKEISDLFIRTGRIQFIVMAFILSGFVVFGKQFILLWAGVEYIDAYVICILFFVSLLIPLIQNLGITILQARNQMKFRSLSYIVIAVFALLLQIVFAKKWGGIGCAIAVSGALLLGQGLIMNIYYTLRQGINILEFWREILKMSIVPVTFILISFFVFQYIKLTNWLSWIAAVIGYSLLYIPIFWKFSMNQYERAIILTPIKKIFPKFFK